MKATGIVRRIDDLGRVVIPRDIRRTMGIRDGEPLEIYTEGNDTVCFRKYSINLSDKIDHLMGDIEDHMDDHEKMAQIKTLLNEARRLVQSEE